MLHKKHSYVNKIYFRTEKIQVKIITTAYDSDDDTLHVLSDKESNRLSQHDRGHDCMYN